MQLHPLHATTASQTGFVVAVKSKPSIQNGGDSPKSSATSPFQVVDQIVSPDVGRSTSSKPDSSKHPIGVVVAVKSKPDVG